MASLASVQELLGRPGELSAILISNRGDVFGGIELTDTVIERYKDYSAVGSSGLELVPIKRDVVDQANETGGIFVSLFTTFGLFSIGVGLLLIFLIFSMLAAERKSEMGMARAVGMQRQHLVRMFTIEGAIYGIGSAIRRRGYRRRTRFSTRRGRIRHHQSNHRSILPSRHMFSL